MTDAIKRERLSFRPRPGRGVAHGNAVVAITPGAQEAYHVHLVRLHAEHVTDIALLGTVGPKQEGFSIQDALRERGVRLGVVQECVLSLPRWDVIVRQLRLPTADAEQIRLMVPFEIANHLPWPAEESVSAYEVLQQHDDGHATVALYIARHDVVEHHLGVLRGHHIHPTRIVPSVRGLSALLRSCSDAERPAVMLVTQNGVEYLRLEGGLPAFSRGIPGTESPQQVLMESLAVDRRRHGTPGACTSLYVAGMPLEALDLSGCPAHEALGAGAFRALNGALPDTVEALQAVAAAVAPADAVDIANLLPAAEQEGLARRRLWRSARRTLALALWLLATVTALGYYEYKVQLHTAESLERELHELGPDIRALREKNEALAYFADERRAAARPLEIVLDLYERTPTPIAINDFRYDSRGTLSLSGESPDFKSLFQFLQALDESPQFEECRLVSSSKPAAASEPLVDFKINCEVSPSVQRTDKAP